MRTPPERILLFRSGRHLQVALDALREDSPSCEVTVVAMPVAATLLDQCGIDEARRIMYDRSPFFRPVPFITSAAGVCALRGRFNRVCVLWNDPEGAGQANVDYTALTVAPFGFTAITADGTLIPRRSGANLRRELARAVSSLAVAATLGLLLFLPARVLAAGQAILGRRGQS
jgi:hypothetical protein